MSILEIVIVAIVGLALILPGLFIERFKSKIQSKIKTRSQRITMLISGAILVGMTLLLSPPGALFPRIGLTLFGAIAILNSLNGWLFNVKVKS